MTLFGIPLGTALQGGTLVAIVLAAISALGIWIKHGPDRARAHNESDQIKIDAAETIRTDYAQQIREFRAEVHGYRNEVQALQGELRKSDRISSQRSDRIDNMMFIIELLISELERLDPKSVIVRQAKAMLRQLGNADNDPAKSTALNRAEHAVRDAKQTVRSATATCEEVKKDEDEQ